LPLASLIPDPVVPALGPDVTAKFTVAPCNGVPQADRFPVTVAVWPPSWVWLAGVSESTAPVAQGGEPIDTHCVES
jgi:hypothetical protein